MAASIAHLSNLYLIKSPYGLIQLGHPDLDTRIFNLMNKVTSNSTEYQDTIDVIYNIFISMFLKKFGIEYETNDVKINGFSSFYQIFDYLYKCIDSEKNDSKHNRCDQLRPNVVPMLYPTKKPTMKFSRLFVLGAGIEPARSLRITGF